MIDAIANNNPTNRKSKNSEVMAKLVKRKKEKTVEAGTGMVVTAKENNHGINRKRPLQIGVFQYGGIKKMEMKEQVRKEYLRGLRKL